MQLFMVYIQSTKGMKKGLHHLARFASLEIRMRGNGGWGMEYGVWNMEYGIWNMGYGIWNMGYGIWDMGFCQELSLQNLMPGAK